MVEESLLYIRNFMRDPRVASVSPTSIRATRRLVEGMELSGCGLVVEYGPGNGVITRELLRRMPAGARLLAVEVNTAFYRDLSRWDDPRLIPVKGSAEDIETIMREQGFGKADVVVSGIPFSLIKESSRREIVRATEAVLADHGDFHVYQASKHVKPLLEEYFGQVETSFVFRNIPPLFILRAHRRAEPVMDVPLAAPTTLSPRR